LGIERAILGHISNTLANFEWLPEDIEAVDHGFARRGGQVAGENPHGGGLAGAVGSQEADNLAGPRVKGNVANRGVIAVVLGQVADVDQETISFASTVEKMADRPQRMNDRRTSRSPE